MKTRFNPSLWLIIIAAAFSSCVNTRKAIYFNIDKDSVVQVNVNQQNVLIQKNDILDIKVSSLSAEASQLYNTQDTKGYLVNREGNITFPVFGVIKVEGKTKEELQEFLTKQLTERKLLSDPMVSVRLASFRVTVLGEVARPGVVAVPTEKISILEALGSAGDMTIHSNRSNVLVIREDQNQRMFKVIDLNSDDVFDSPYFYLKPNDVVYVRPTKTRISSTNPARTWLPTVISLLSFGAIIATRVIN
jgi:polysaccharide export outer membrane protein